MEYAAVSATSAVKAPGPAYIGKAKGTIALPLPISPSNLSFWKIVISNTISIAIRKITNPPAIAKYSIFTPKIFRIHSPANRNAIRMIRLAKQTLQALILIPRFSMLIVMGIFPKGSMMAIMNTKADIICQISSPEKKFCIVSIGILSNLSAKLLFFLHICKFFCTFAAFFEKKRFFSSNF